MLRTRMRFLGIFLFLLWCLPTPGSCKDEGLLDGLPIVDADLLSDQRFLKASALDFQAFELVEEKRYKEALPLAQEALENFKKTLGSQHPRTLTTLNNIGLIHHKLGDLDKARSIYEQVLKSREEILGPEHLHTAISLINLAALYFSLGQYQEALPLYRRALKIYEQRKGKEDPTTVSIQRDMNYLEQVIQGKPATKKLGKRPPSEGKYK